MPTPKSLLIKLKITNFEISRRKELFEFCNGDAATLMLCSNLVREHIDKILTTFYQKQKSANETASPTQHSDRQQRLYSAQRAYILSLFDGCYDIEYVKHRLRIGMMHRRIGGEPKLYLSALKALKDSVVAALDTYVQEKSFLAKVADALDKLLYFDAMLVLDVYIQGFLTEVEAAKSQALSYANDLEAKIAERTSQLQELALRDALTALYNQRGLRDYLRRELKSAKRYKKNFALAYIDIDHFKQINDHHGHLAGDGVLRTLGEAIQKSCRETDFPCRYGGDEFCLALPDCSLSEAKDVCDRIIDLFSNRIADVTFSIGIAQTGPHDFLDPDALIGAADSKMYEAKANQGFQICK